LNQRDVRVRHKARQISGFAAQRGSFDGVTVEMKIQAAIEEMAKMSNRRV